MDTEKGFNNTEYLVNRFLDDLVRLSLVYVKNIDDAQDVAQQVFVTYIQKKPEFISEEHAKHWLFKVTVNISKNRLRAKRNGEISYDELEGVISTEDTEKTEREQEVFSAVMRLRPIYKEVVHLYYYVGYSTQEIAKLLGMPSASVRSRLARARAELENELKGGDGSEE